MTTGDQRLLLVASMPVPLPGTRYPLPVVV